MSTLQNKIDFVALISVNMANANGDPLNGNRPRTDYNNYGEISDVCIKRKIRNRMQDQGYPIFVQSEDRCDDGLGSLSERASTTLKGIKNREEYTKKACETWLDVRAFGQVFAFKSKDSVSAGVRGPVSIHQAVSISPWMCRRFRLQKVSTVTPVKNVLQIPWAISILCNSAFIFSKAPSMCSWQKKQASQKRTHKW